MVSGFAPTLSTSPTFMGSDLAPPSAKRQRVDEPESSTSPSLRKITRSDIWYDDGSVVLQAEFVQFRVYREFLAQNSPVLKDLFESGSASTTSEETVDKCPVVHLRKDTATDVRYLLHAIHNWSMYPPWAFGMKPFPVVAAMLRLGKKYRIKHVYDSALRHIRGDYVSSLENPFTSANPFRNIYIERTEGDEFKVVRLLRDTGIHSPLPVAYYACGRTYSTAKLLDEDSFTPEDRTICLVGLEKLRAQSLAAFQGWVCSATSGCTCPGACCKAKAAVVITLSARGYDYDAFQPWDAQWGVDLCPPCLEAAQTLYEDNRVSLWRRLPSFFDLPDWDELAKTNKM
ncbi:hypothetical protein PLICRDRAFT_255081 [Plicaturopsis crispa FD-325 SS-3]|nr:hypothetical protein PLICRDRAFT_255081 [Plicaturopsis crispa FD-325 SS-3]